MLHAKAVADKLVRPKQFKELAPVRERRESSLTNEDDKRHPTPCMPSGHVLCVHPHGVLTLQLSPLPRVRAWSLDRRLNALVIHYRMVQNPRKGAAVQCADL